MAAATVKVGMLVFNTCHADARVLRESETLQSQGYQVRIIAFGNRHHPVGLTRLDSGVEIQRVPIVSLLTIVLGWFRACYLAMRLAGARGPAGPARPTETPFTSRRARLDAVHRLSRRARAARDLRLWRSAKARRYRWLLRGLYLRVRPSLIRVLLPLHLPSQLYTFGRNASDALIAWKPDVVHVHDANTLLPGVRVSRTAGVPLVYDSHELWRHRNKKGARPLGRLSDMVVESVGIRHASAVITVSPGLVDWLRRRYGLAADRVHLLRNTPSRVRHSHAPDLRQLAGLTSEDKILLYTGRITTGRGVEESIDALVDLPDSVHLIMLGYGEPNYVETLLRRAALEGLAHRVHLVGPVPHEQVSATASQADVAVVAVVPTCLSYRHCLPNKLFESIQAGLPIVASDLPDVSDLLLEYGIGETFSLDDRGSMHRALVKALEDPETVKANVASAARQLCWEVESARLLEVYRQTLAVAARPPVPVNKSRYPRPALATVGHVSRAEGSSSAVA